MDMIRSRNLSSHTYNAQTANDIADAIIRKYFACFEALHSKLLSLEPGPS